MFPKSKATMEKNKISRLCVTGAAGFIGCSLVKKLLEQGHTVHATLRNLEDASKVAYQPKLSGQQIVAVPS
ncbi:unnamed protein product [Prunus brigantina]